MSGEQGEQTESGDVTADGSLDGMAFPGDIQSVLPLGTRLGPYEVTEHIAVGGMAHVYKVWHSGLHRYEAMKVPLSHLRHDPNFLRRFFQEARFAAKLQHPNIVGIYAVSESFGAGQSDGGESYFTMELIEGTDLDRLLGERGRLSMEEAIPILRGIADALDYAHARGVVHRDMKPSNVLLGTAPDHFGAPPTGTTGDYSPKVSDFGIARAAVDDERGDNKSKVQRLTKVGAILGTPAYMSPEQAGNGEPVSPASDQYSLGIIAYELLCGHTPFVWKPDSPFTVIFNHLRDAPPPLIGVGRTLLADASINEVLGRALAKTRAERFPSCRVFVEALNEASRAGATMYDPVRISPPTPVLRQTIPTPPQAQVPQPPQPPHILSEAPTQIPRPTPVLTPTQNSQTLTPPTSEFQALCERLADHLPADRDRRTFINSCNLLAQQGQGQPFDTDTLATAEKSLAHHIGPLAKVLVKRAARDATDRADFYRRLTEQLSSPAEKIDFLRRLRV